jgi:Bacterial Ig domain
MRRALSVLAVLAAVVCISVAWAGGTAQAQSLGQATLVKAPAGAPADPNAVLNAIACPAAGECVAVGQYTDSKGIKQAMVVDQADGTWAQAEMIASPAEPKAGPYGASLSSVACTAAGKCIAVGGYTDSAGDLRPMQVTQTNGFWNSSATAVAIPAGADSNPDSALVAIACPGAGSGSCVALGYFEESEYRQMMIASASTSGVGSPVKVTPPANTVAEGETSWPKSNYLGPLLASVGCSDPGTCVSVGNYPAKPLEEILPMSTTGASATASEITTISQPVGQSSGSLGQLIAIACPGTGYCEAGGGVDGEAMVVSEAPNGKWAQETAIAAPDSGANARVQGLACPDYYSCLAVGNYSGGSFVTSEQDEGKWGAAENVPAPTGGSGSALWGVSCPPKDTSDCWGAGSFSETSDSYGQAMVVQDSTSENGGGSKPIPVCEDVTTSTEAGKPTTVALKCSETGNVSLTYVIDTSPSHGALGTVEQANGHVSYTPAAGFSGNDSFTYHATSSNGTAATKTVTIAVTPPASPGTGGSGGPGGSGGSGGSGGGGATVIPKGVPRIQALPSHTKIAKASISSGKRSAKFSFSAQAATSFQCELILPAKKGHKQPKPKFGACGSSKGYTHLNAGKYTFLVRGVNSAGVDPTPARKTFTIG